MEYLTRSIGVQMKDFVINLLAFLVSAGLFIVGKWFVVDYLLPHLNRKKYLQKAIKFRSAKECAITPHAHGEPFWRITENNINNNNNRFVLTFDSNNQDKSKNNIYVVDRIISERIGINEEPKQIIEMKKIPSSEREKERKKLFGIKAVIFIKEGNIFKALLLKKDNKLDSSFTTLLETKDLGYRNPVFNCTKRGWETVTQKITAGENNNFPELKPESIKYGDLFSDKKYTWLTAFVIFEGEDAKVIEKELCSVHELMKIVVMSDEISNITNGREKSLKSLMDSQDNLTNNGNYTLLMAYARIINNTLNA